MTFWQTIKALVVLVSVLGCGAMGLRGGEDQPAGPGFQVHGRLSLYNGNPGVRIWVVGTKRILGVAESPPEVSLMPAKLGELVQDQVFVFGDFTVVPLTKDEPGVMRMVRVIRAERLVITDGNLNFIRRMEGPLTLDQK